jgi:bifunctional DNase/RNase
MIQVKVEQIFLSNAGFVVILKGLNEERSLPIFIGAAEAQAIAFQVNNVKVPRPLTHDLLKNMLDFLECRVLRIEVCEVREGTFFARVVIEKDGCSWPMDSRPSDAIALALRCAAPIFVAAAVMEEAGRVIELGDEEKAQGELHGSVAAGEPPHQKKPLTPLAALNRKLERAVQDERYEDAARLRDEIQKLKPTHTEN